MAKKKVYSATGVRFEWNTGRGADRSDSRAGRDGRGAGLELAAGKTSGWLKCRAFAGLQWPI